MQRNLIDSDVTIARIHGCTPRLLVRLSQTLALIFILPIIFMSNVRADQSAYNQYIENIEELEAAFKGLIEEPWYQEPDELIDAKTFNFAAQAAVLKHTDKMTTNNLKVLMKVLGNVTAPPAAKGDQIISVLKKEKGSLFKKLEDQTNKPDDNLGTSLTQLKSALDTIDINNLFDYTKKYLLQSYLHVYPVPSSALISSDIIKVQPDSGKFIIDVVKQLVLQRQQAYTCIKEKEIISYNDTGKLTCSVSKNGTGIGELKQLTDISVGAIPTSTPTIDSFIENNHRLQLFNKQVEGLDVVELEAALNKMLPQPRATGIEAMQFSQQLLTKVIGERQSLQRWGMNSGDNFNLGDLWTAFGYQHARINTEDLLLGFNVQSRVISIGLDHSINNHVLLGIAFNHVRADINGVDSSNDSLDATGKSLSIYSHFEHNNLFIDAHLSYTRSKNTNNRYGIISNNQDLVVYTSNYNGDAINTAVSAGIDLDIGNKAFFKPQIVFYWGSYMHESFGEHEVTDKGFLAFDALKLYNYKTLEVGISSVFGTSFIVDEVNIEPKFSCSFLHDFNSEPIKMALTYQDSQLMTSGVTRTKNRIEVGVGTAITHESCTISLDYSLNLGSKSKAHGLSLKLNYEF